MRKTSSTCVRVSGNFFVLSTILKQRNRASRKMVYYKKAPMLLNENLANDSGQETIFVEWELLKVNLFVCFVFCFILFFFCCVQQRASLIYLKTQMFTHLKKRWPFLWNRFKELLHLQDSWRKYRANIQMKATSHHPRREHWTSTTTMLEGSCTNLNWDSWNNYLWEMWESSVSYCKIKLLSL